MNKTETFKKVYLNGDEKNLPKEDGKYFAHFIKSMPGAVSELDESTRISTAYYYKTDYYKEYWLRDIDWYLIEQPVQIAKGGRKYRSIPDDMDIETWDAMTPMQRIEYKGLLLKGSVFQQPDPLPAGKEIPAEAEERKTIDEKLAEEAKLYYSRARHDGRLLK